MSFINNNNLSILAIIGFGISLILHAISFLGIYADILSQLGSLLSLGILPLFLMLALRFQGSNLTLGKLKHSSGILLIFVVLIMGYAAINFHLTSSLMEGGTPIIKDGKYIFQSHGTFIRELSSTEYFWQKAYALRLITGHSMCFYFALYAILHENE